MFHNSLEGIDSTPKPLYICNLQVGSMVKISEHDRICETGKWPYHQWDYNLLLGEREKKKHDIIWKDFCWCFYQQAQQKGENLEGRFWNGIETRKNNNNKLKNTETTGTKD